MVRFYIIFVLVFMITILEIFQAASNHHGREHEYGLANILGNNGGDDDDSSDDSNSSDVTGPDTATF
jgi:hypothetical protein